MTTHELRKIHGESSQEEPYNKVRSTPCLIRAGVGRITMQSLGLSLFCLFHVCDSDFIKFTTQLAGVQKLPSI